jgi:ATP-dependent Zn protease
MKRSAAEDYRIAVHESGHALVARYFDRPLGGATIVPDEDFGGRVFGPDLDYAFQSKKDSELSTDNICTTVDRLMPRAGESIAAAEAWYRHVYESAIELVAGLEAERLIVPKEAKAATASSDYRKAIRYTATICASVEPFIEFAHSEARAILTNFRPILEALAAELIERKTMTGAETDGVIFSALAATDAASERKRRGNWQQLDARVALAAKFEEVPR